MFKGYRITHPKMAVSIDVILGLNEVRQIRSELAEIGEGGKVVSMSDLPNCMNFYAALEIIREHY